jgi:hypothetical protein
VAEKCDCLNMCGDDARVLAYLVEPCDYRLRAAKARQAELQAKIDQMLADAAIRLDAARYQVLRSASWFNSSLCVVSDPKTSIKLGSDCPSGQRLDDLCDAEIAKEGKWL